MIDPYNKLMNISSHLPLNQSPVSQSVTSPALKGTGNGANNGGQAEDPGALAKGDHVALSDETRESARQTKPGDLPPDQKVGGAKETQQTDLSKASGQQAPAQKFNVSEAGPDQSRALYNKESAPTQGTQQMQASASAAALASTPKPGQISRPQTVGATNPQHSADMNEDRPANGITRSQFIQNLKNTFSDGSRSKSQS
jgi:hypothetical protein